MWREQNGLLDFIFWPQPRDEIGTIRQNFLKFNFESGAGGDGVEKICDAFFTGVRMARRQEGRVHAGQRNKFGQQFFRARHGGNLTIWRAGVENPVRMTVNRFAQTNLISDALLRDLAPG
jgi:hypothetical protein